MTRRTTLVIVRRLAPDVIRLSFEVETSPSRKEIHHWDLTVERALELHRALEAEAAPR